MEEYRTPKRFKGLFTKTKEVVGDLAYDTSTLLYNIGDRIVDMRLRRQFEAIRRIGPETKGDRQSCDWGTRNDLVHATFVDDRRGTGLNGTWWLRKHEGNATTDIRFMQRQIDKDSFRLHYEKTVDESGTHANFHFPISDSSYGSSATYAEMHQDLAELIDFVTNFSGTPSVTEY